MNDIEKEIKKYGEHKDVKNTIMREINQNKTIKANYCCALKRYKKHRTNPQPNKSSILMLTNKLNIKIRSFVENRKIIVQKR